MKLFSLGLTELQAWVAVYALFAAFFPTTLKAKNRVDLNFKVEGSKTPHSLSGEITYELDGESEACFFLPFNDPDYRTYSRISERLDLQKLGNPLVAPSGGFTKIQNLEQLKRLRADLYRIKNPSAQKIILKFNSQLPRFFDSDDRQWFFYDFYPILLKSCPDLNQTSPSDFLKKGDFSFHVSAQTPSSWTYLAPNMSAQGHQVWGHQVDAPEFSFALIKEHSSSKFHIGDLDVLLYFYDPDFLKLSPTIEQAYREFLITLPKLPLKALHVVESLQKERDDLPGIVVTNRPRQESFHDIQKEWLNWAHWTIVTLLSRQWWGSFIKPEASHDDWLVRGTAEFLAEKSVSKIESRYDLFNVFEGATNLLDMDYRQVQDMGASLLNQDEPDALLTNDKLISAKKIDAQHPMLALRQAIAMRHLSGMKGDIEFRAIMRELTEALMGKAVSPQDFFDQLRKLLNPTLERFLLEDFRNWWTKKGWPDFKIESYETNLVENGSGFITDVQIKQLSTLELDIPVSLTDQRGRKTTQNLKRKDLKNGTYRLKMPSDTPVKKIIVDENRLLYDDNRYNNSTEWPGLMFYPGNARGFPDDAYMIVWLPYPVRRPGQAWSLSLIAGLFRYIDSSATILAERELSGKERSAFSYQQIFKNPEKKLDTSVYLRQNIYGSRLLQLLVAYGPLFSFNPRMISSLAFRHRQVVGAPQTRHQTIAPQIDIRPFGRSRFVGFHLWGEYEIAPPQSDPIIGYERRFVVGEVYTYWRNFFDYGLRVFRGSLLTNKGNIAEEFYFDPLEGREARLRLDDGNLARSSELFTLGHDLLLPILLPLKKTGIIVAERLKWHLFYDFGRSYKPDATYEDAGIGIDVPLGGDVMGVGTVAITKISLLTVLYSKINDEVSRSPHVLFNIGADF